MILVFISLWVIAAIIYINDSERLKWASLTAFAGGFGAFGRVLKDTLKPYLLKYDLLTESVNVLLNWLYVFGSLINILGLPYFFLLFALSYNQVISERHFKRASAILILPIALMLIRSFPYYSVPDYNYKLMIGWVGPYIISGLYFFLKGYLTERNPIFKRSKSFTLILVFPVLFQLFTVYIMRVFSIYETFRFNVISVTLLFICFIIFIIKYDVLGIKVKFENNKLDHSLQAVTSSNEILNHAIKNHVVKINASTANLKQNYIDSKQQSIPFELHVIEESSEQLIEMMKRIHEKSQQISLEKKDYAVKRLIDDVLMGVDISTKQKNIVITSKVAAEINIVCDPFHVKESLLNIINNSIEAINGQGEIIIDTIKDKKYVTILIKDNGEGIAENNLQRIYDPFFSTKKRTLNFGIGLSYCHQVMQKHGGSIKIDSKKGDGTTVYLNFPLQREKIG